MGDLGKQIDQARARNAAPSDIPGLEQAAHREELRNSETSSADSLSLQDPRQVTKARTKVRLRDEEKLQRLYYMRPDLLERYDKLSAADWNVLNKYWYWFKQNLPEGAPLPLQRGPNEPLAQYLSMLYWRGSMPQPPWPKRMEKKRKRQGV